jgi:hypothetical protein
LALERFTPFRHECYFIPSVSMVDFTHVDYAALGSCNRVI